MLFKLPFNPLQPDQSMTIPLDGVQYELRLVHRARRQSWYLDIRDEQGRPVVLGRRLSPGWSPHAGVVGGPPGALVPVASDPYARDEIELWYIDAAEFAAAPPADVDLLPLEIST